MKCTKLRRLLSRVFRCIICQQKEKDTDSYEHESVPEECPVPETVPRECDVAESVPSECSVVEPLPRRRRVHFGAEHVLTYEFDKTQGLSEPHLLRTSASVNHSSMGPVQLSMSGDGMSFEFREEPTRNYRVPSYTFLGETFRRSCPSLPTSSFKQLKKEEKKKSKEEEVKDFINSLSLEEAKILLLY